MTENRLLSDIEIHRALAAMPGWARKGNALVRTWQFSSYAAGIEWVGHVAGIADAHDHHPDIDVRYTRITLVITTHSAGGITHRDFALARAIDDETVEA